MTTKVNLGLLELIRAKREAHWRPSIEELKQGFRGWHQRGYLPHFDAPHVTQMVTFMLVDSFPVTRKPEWEPALNEPDQSVKRRKVEEWLDRGHGKCWLGRSKVAQVVERLLLEANQSEFEMLAWAIMPNHIHVVLGIRDIPLARLVNQWKGRSSREANKLLGRRGHFWQEDYYDTVIRNAEHLGKAIRYSEENPVKAGLVKTAREWMWSSARHRDAYGRLGWQR